MFKLAIGNTLLPKADFALERLGLFFQIITLKVCFCGSKFF
jgi:hypothetical protein